MNDEKGNGILNFGTISTLVLAGYLMHKGETAVKLMYAVILAVGLGGFFFLASFAEMKAIISAVFSALWTIVSGIAYLIVMLPISFIMAAF